MQTSTSTPLSLADIQLKQNTLPEYYKSKEDFETHLGKIEEFLSLFVEPEHTTLPATALVKFIDKLYVIPEQFKNEILSSIFDYATTYIKTYPNPEYGETIEVAEYLSIKVPSMIAQISSRLSIINQDSTTKQVYTPYIENIIERNLSKPGTYLPPQILYYPPKLYDENPAGVRYRERFDYSAKFPEELFPIDPFTFLACLQYFNYRRPNDISSTRIYVKIAASYFPDSNEVATWDIRPRNLSRRLIMSFSLSNVSDFLDAVYQIAYDYEGNRATQEEEDTITIEFSRFHIYFFNPDDNKEDLKLDIEEGHLVSDFRGEKEVSKHRLRAYDEAMKAKNSKMRLYENRVFNLTEDKERVAAKQEALKKLRGGARRKATPNIENKQELIDFIKCKDNEILEIPKIKKLKPKAHRYKSVLIADYIQCLDFESKDNNCLLEILRQVRFEEVSIGGVEIRNKNYPNADKIRAELSIEPGTQISAFGDTMLKLEEYFETCVNIISGITLCEIQTKNPSAEEINKARSPNGKAKKEIFTTLKSLRAHFATEVTYQPTYVRQSYARFTKSVDILLIDNHYILVDDYIVGANMFCPISGLPYTAYKTKDKRVRYKKPKLAEIRAHLVERGRIQAGEKVIRHFMFDFETIYNEHGELIPYSVSFYDSHSAAEYKLKNPEVTKQELESKFGVLIKGEPLKIARDLLSILRNFATETFVPYENYLWGYNNSRFDNYFLLKFIKQYSTINEKTIFVANGALLTMYIMNYKVLDLCKFTNASLAKICRDFKIEEDSVKLSLDHTIVQSHYEKDKKQFYFDLMDEQGIFAGLRDYNIRDCSVLYEIIMKINSAINTMFPDPKFAFKGIHKYLTLSSMAYSLFQKTLGKQSYTQSVNEKILNNRIQKPKTLELSNKIRSSIVAGRSQIFQVGKFEIKMESQDIRSMYPYVLISAECFYPTGRIEFYWETNDFIKFELLYEAYRGTKNQYFHADKLGFYFCKISNQPDIKIIPRRLEGKPLDWNYEGAIDCWLTTIDIFTLVENDCCVEIKEGFYYDDKRNDIFKEYYKGPIMAKMEQDCLKESLDPEIRAKYNPSIREISKLLQNGLPGKFNEKNHNEKVLFTQSEEEYYKFLSMIHEIKAARDNVIIETIDDVYRVKVSADVFYSSERSKEVQWGVYVYSYARRHIYKAIFRHIASDEVYCTDTDSAHLPTTAIDRLRDRSVKLFKDRKQDLIKLNFFGEYVDSEVLKRLNLCSVGVQYGMFTSELQELGADINIPKTCYYYRPKFYGIEYTRKDGSKGTKIRAKGVKQNDKVVDIEFLAEKLIGVFDEMNNDLKIKVAELNNTFCGSDIDKEELYYQLINLVIPHYRFTLKDAIANMLESSDNITEITVQFLELLENYQLSLAEKTNNALISYRAKKKSLKKEFTHCANEEGRCLRTNALCDNEVMFGECIREFFVCADVFKRKEIYKHAKPALSLELFESLLVKRTPVFIISECLERVVYDRNSAQVGNINQRVFLKILETPKQLLSNNTGALAVQLSRQTTNAPKDLYFPMTDELLDPFGRPAIHKLVTPPINRDKSFRNIKPNYNYVLKKRLKKNWAKFINEEDLPEIYKTEEGRTKWHIVDVVGEEVDLFTQQYVGVTEESDTKWLDEDEEEGDPFARQYVGVTDEELNNPKLINKKYEHFHYFSYGKSKADPKKHLTKADLKFRSKIELVPDYFEKLACSTTAIEYIYRGITYTKTGITNPSDQRYTIDLDKITIDTLPNNVLTSKSLSKESQTTEAPPTKTPISLADYFLDYNGADQEDRLSYDNFTDFFRYAQIDLSYMKKSKIKVEYPNNFPNLVKVDSFYKRNRIVPTPLDGYFPDRYVTKHSGDICHGLTLKEVTEIEFLPTRFAYQYNKNEKPKDVRPLKICTFEVEGDDEEAHYIYLNPFYRYSFDNRKKSKSKTYISDLEIKELAIKTLEKFPEHANDIFLHHPYCGAHRHDIIETVNVEYNTDYISKRSVPIPYTGLFYNVISNTLSLFDENSKLVIDKKMIPTDESIFRPNPVTKAYKENQCSKLEQNDFTKAVFDGSRNSYTVELFMRRLIDYDYTDDYLSKYHVWHKRDEWLPTELGTLIAKVPCGYDTRDGYRYTFNDNMIVGMHRARDGYEFYLFKDLKLTDIKKYFKYCYKDLIEKDEDEDVDVYVDISDYEFEYDFDDFDYDFDD